ncbi:MAG: DUF4418 family protein [Bacillota bacterium]
MRNKFANIPGIVGMLIGILIIFTPFHLAPVCQGLLELTNGKMVPMRCHYTGQAEVYLGILIVFTALLLFLSKSYAVKKSLALILVALGIVVILLPTKLGIGVCMSPMECHTTAKFLYTLGALLIINGLAAQFVYEQQTVNPPLDSHNI